jgi:hypothetical protein
MKIDEIQEKLKSLALHCYICNVIDFRTKHLNVRTVNKHQSNVTHKITKGTYGKYVYTFSFLFRKLLFFVCYIFH